MPHRWQADPSLFLPDPLQGEQNMSVQPVPPQAKQRISPRPAQLLHFVDPLQTEQYDMGIPTRHRLNRSSHSIINKVNPRTGTMNADAATHFSLSATYTGVGPQDGHALRFVHVLLLARSATS